MSSVVNNRNIEFSGDVLKFGGTKPSYGEITMKMFALLISLFGMSAVASAKTVNYVSCSGPDWKVASQLNLDTNKITQKTTDGRKSVMDSVKPIVEISIDDIAFLNSEGAIAATDIQSGYKAVIAPGADGGRTSTVYFIDLKAGGQALAYGAMVVAGPCGK
ncbi:hypothetical protein ACLVWU_15680 [Bdellovibrio sp. HCB290]|uniref:hypothetical protein n=1 Tax=Bdellovibrio sp. HCB290 TaxID=3394356 RepID=UPI0039B58FFC